MEKVIVNGELIERKDAVMDIEDRGYQFGDGIYEVIRVYNGKMYTAEEHLKRLYESAEKIGLKIHYQKDEIKSHAARLIDENMLETGIIYMQFSRGIAPRQHAFPLKDVACSYIAYTREMPRPEASLDKGVKTLLVEDIRWLRCDIKSLNLLGNILAKQKAAESDCYEAIQHRGEIVTEGSSSNVFIVKDGTVMTHPATNLILNGITRQVIQKVCAENAVPFVEKEFTVEQLLAADEVFLGSTTSEVMPIIQVDKTVIGEGVPGSMTRKLQELFSQHIQKECTLLQNT
ncbi:D-amino-acid transaminase [Falsibacillus pallidus]|uniref:D-alanine aminotransferase n=1 Tax=Falsibacillus pallidus TaxID=493781 RepID=A0A370GKN9_9BACI|nr:D-amino-acid transaminase [Falsibacillus pallidus]RDI44332.1 D-alanine transaminase [Falsibacillus pallidus]